MLTGRAAELRPWVNYLHVHPIVLVSPEQARAEAMARPAPMENAESLKTRGRMANMRRRTARKTRDSARATVLAERGITMIPTSGAARRRAKACRNREAVEAMTARWTDDETAIAPRAFNARGFLYGILNWCNGQPHLGPLPDSEPIQMRREADGTVTVVGEAPRFLSISADLLELAHQDYLSFADGVLTMDVQPEVLHYRPLGPDLRSFTIVFERVQ